MILLRNLNRLSRFRSIWFANQSPLNKGRHSTILISIDHQNVKHLTHRTPIQQQQQQQQSNKPKETNAKFVEDGVRMPIRERLKHMAVLYGPLATVLHISLSLTFLGITYVVVKYGFDALGFLQNNDFLSENYMRILSTGGTFGLAYALYKAMMPFRVLVTIFLTPKVATKLQSMGLIKKRF